MIAREEVAGMLDGAPRNWPSNLDVALDCMRRERPTFVCRPDNKRPACMRGFHAATLLERQIRTWWRPGGKTWAGKGEDRAEFANESLIPGSPCGLQHWGGYWVLDVDAPSDKHPDAQGPQSLALLVETFGELPPTLRARTWTGGQHWYFRHPGVPWTVPNRQSMLGLGVETWGEDGYPEMPFGVNASGRLLVPGIDVRGDGGYVIVPGAVMLDGRRYEWLEGCSPAEIEMADAPDWLLALVAVPPEEERPPAPEPARPQRQSSPAGKDGRPGGGSDFFRRVNDEALRNLGAWVSAVLPGAKPYHNGATGEHGFRVTSKALGRSFEEDLSLMPSGIKDYGPDPTSEGIGMTPIDVVMAWGSAGKPLEAARWLCVQLGVEPEALGWERRTRPAPTQARAAPPPGTDGGETMPQVVLRAFAKRMLAAGARGATLAAVVLAHNADAIDPPLPLEEAAAIAAAVEAECGCADPLLPIRGERGSSPGQHQGSQDKGGAPCPENAPLPAARDQEGGASCPQNAPFPTAREPAGPPPHPPGSPPPNPAPPGRPPGRPRIEVHPGEISQITDDAEHYLIESNIGVYQRGTLLVRIGRWSGVKQWALRPVGAAVLIEVSAHWLVDVMSRTIEWQVWDARKGDLAPKDAPMKVAQLLISRAGEWRFPYLTGFVDAPTLDRDGRLIAARGYDEASGLYLLDPPDIGGPIDDVDRYSAERGVEILSEIVETFPFATEGDRAACLAAILTALLRRSLPAAPICAISASTPGSGKSLLVDVIGILAQGRKVTVANIGQDSEEFEKRLDAALLAGDQLVNWDNVDRAIKSDTLCSVTTQETKKVRILSKSVEVPVPTNIAWFMTGNNLTLVGDLVRRALLVTLDPQCERPEQREFDRDAIEYALERRCEALRAALTISRAYLLAGCPDVGCKPHGSYDLWEKLVRRPLMWAGCPDPLQGAEELREADQELVGLEELLAAWYAITREPVTAAELRELMDERHDSFQNGVQWSHPHLRDAAKGVMGDFGRWDAQKLGYRLRGSSKRLFQGPGGAWYRIVKCGRGRGGVLWQVQRGPPWPGELADATAA